MRRPILDGDVEGVVLSPLGTAYVDPLFRVKSAGPPGLGSPEFPSSGEADADPFGVNHWRRGLVAFRTRSDGFVGSLLVPFGAVGRCTALLYPTGRRSQTSLRPASP